VKLTARTIQALGRVITGDGNMSPYRSGPELVSFFNEHGGNSRYGQGFPSRWQFTENELHKLNDSDVITRVLLEAVDPRAYMDSSFLVEAVVEHLNNYLAYDGYQLVRNGLFYQLRPIDQSGHVPSPIFTKRLDIQKGGHAFILEQSDKCREKIESGDFDGAITNARSMVEAVFEELLVQAKVPIPKHDGDLNRLFKEVKRNLNLDTDQIDLSDTLKQLLSGLNSIVTGLAGLSNKMSDRHARKYKPAKHHAMMAIGMAYALCEFLLSSLEYQKKKGSK